MKVDIEHIQIMNVEPGDTLILTLKSEVMKEEMVRMKIILADLYPQCKVLVINGVQEIRIVRGLDD